MSRLPQVPLLHALAQRVGRMVAGAVAASVCLLLLSGCQTPHVADNAGLPAASSAPQLSAASSAEKRIRYIVRSDLSDLRFLVYRAGPLARLGHNHVVQATNIQGEIHLAPDFERSAFWLKLPVADFKVDAVGPRSEEGDEFSTLPDEDAIAGTTRNMRGEKVLDAARFPYVDIMSLALRGPSWGPDVTLRIRLHGVERDITVPIAIENSGEQLVVTAQFSVKQSDFGITPLSVFGGAIQVADTVRVRMRLVSRRG